MSAEQVPSIETTIDDTRALNPILGFEGRSSSFIDADPRVYDALEAFRAANIVYGEFLLANVVDSKELRGNNLTTRDLLFNKTVNAGFSLEALRKHVKRERLVSIAEVQDLIV